MKKVRLQCPCGEMIVADGEDDLVEKANQHLEQDHPDLAGVYTREQILVMAY